LIGSKVFGLFRVDIPCVCGTPPPRLPKIEVSLRATPPFGAYGTGARLESAVTSGEEVEYEITFVKTDPSATEVSDTTGYGFSLQDADVYPVSSKTGMRI